MITEIKDLVNKQKVFLTDDIKNMAWGEIKEMMKDAPDDAIVQWEMEYEWRDTSEVLGLDSVWFRWKVKE